MPVQSKHGTFLSQSRPPFAGRRRLAAEQKDSSLNRIIAPSPLSPTLEEMPSLSDHWCSASHCSATTTRSRSYKSCLSSPCCHDFATHRTRCAPRQISFCTGVYTFLPSAWPGQTIMQQCLAPTLCRWDPENQLRKPPKPTCATAADRLRIGCGFALLPGS